MSEIERLRAEVATLRADVAAIQSALLDLLRALERDQQSRVDALKQLIRQVGAPPPPDAP